MARTKSIPLAVVALGAVYLVFAFAYGPRETADLPAYLAMADAFAALHFNLARYLREGQALSGLDAHIPIAFYSAYAALVAVTRALLGDRWLQGLLVANVLAQAAAGGAVLLMVRRAAIGPAAQLIAGAFLLALFDYYQWIAATQSDPLFGAEAVGAVLLALLAATAGGGPQRATGWIACVALVALAVLTRPAWPPLVATIAVTATLAPALRDESAMARSTRWRLAMAGGAVAVVVAGLVACALLYFRPALLPDALAEIVNYYRPDFVGGIVIIARPETFLPPDESVAGILRVMLARMAYFFWFTAAEFSPRHAALNIATHVPLYALALVGAAAAVAGRAPTRLGTLAGVVAIVWIVLTDAYHAVTHLDYAWRYRVPVYPALILLAAMGADLVAARVRGRSSAAVAAQV